MASRFWVPSAGSGTGTWDASSTTHWAASSNGAGGQSVPVAGDTITFDAASCPLGETVTVNTDFSVTSITMGAFTGTLDFSANNNSPTMQTFNCSGTGVRTLNMGNGTWTVSGNAATIWTIATTTSLTFNAGSSTINFSYSGSTGTRTFTAGSGLVYNNISFSAGADIVAVFSSATYNNIDFTGFTGNWAETTGTKSITGNFTLGSGMTVDSNSSVMNFVGTSGTQVIRTNSVQINHPFTINTTVGVTVQLFDNLNIDGASNRTLTLTQGTFDANNKNVTCQTFSSSNSNTRVLTMGSGTWTLTGNAATIWSIATSTGLTLTGSGVVDCTYSGSTGTRTINSSVNTAASIIAMNNLKISAGSDAVSILNGTNSSFNTVDFTGFTGSLGDFTGSGLNLFGDLKLGVGMTVPAATRTFTFKATSGTQTITSNSVSFGFSITEDGVGGTLSLADAIVLASTRTLTLTNGTLTANNKNVTAGAFSSSNSNTRSLLMGTGTWTLTGTGTVWTTATTTGLTFSRGASVIKITDSSVTANTFSGGGLTFATLLWARGASTASNTIVGNNTFGLFQDTGTAAHSILFTAGSTQTFDASIYNYQLSPFQVSGNSGNLISINSTSTATHTLALKAATRPVASTFLNIQHSIATSDTGYGWYAGENSTNNQSVATIGTGWVFTEAPRKGGNPQNISGTLRVFSDGSWKRAPLRYDGKLVQIKVYDNGWKTIE